MSALDPKALDAAVKAIGRHGIYTSTATMEAAITAYLAASPKGQVEAVAWADPLAIEKLKGTPATAVYLSKNGSAAYSMPLYASPAPSGEERIQIAERLITEYHEHCMAAGKSSIEYPAGLQHQASAFLAGRHDLLSPAPSGGWQDMSSAPKDGDPVLMEYISKYDGKLYYCVTRWTIDHWRGYPQTNFTRWSRPFPAAPSQVEG